jgi:hypothetical protein
MAAERTTDGTPGKGRGLQTFCARISHANDMSPAQRNKPVSQVRLV